MRIARNDMQLVKKDCPERKTMWAGPVTHENGHEKSPETANFGALAES